MSIKKEGLDMAKRSGSRAALMESGGPAAPRQSPLGPGKNSHERYSHECSIKGLTSGGGER
jgi:hypothetical protein